MKYIYSSGDGEIDWRRLGLLLVGDVAVKFLGLDSSGMQ